MHILFIIVCLACIIYLRLIGMIVIPIYAIAFFSITGLASIDLSKTQNIILLLTIACIILYFISIRIFLPLLLADLSFVAIHDFYHTVGTTIIDDFILKDYVAFNDLLEKRCFYIKEKSN